MSDPIAHTGKTRSSKVTAQPPLELMRSLPELNPPENIKLPNDPSPISGHLSAPEPAPPAQPSGAHPRDPSSLERLLQKPEGARRPGCASYHGTDARYLDAPGHRAGR
jgi:hypothetical protein